MSRQNKLNALAQGIIDNVDGCLGASVVDLETGFALAAAVHDDSLELDLAAAYATEMVKAKMKAIKALGLESDLNDIVLTFEDQLHIITPITSKNFIYTVFTPDVDPVQELHGVIAYNRAQPLGTLTAEEQPRHAAPHPWAA
ncbi:hypothetical protein QP027_08440 [Corynebacterium breve]|uniref:Roadblock/LC7 domain-containing protein n=1 Tax=Corynebacterium breve TaxID=3049799 RepID=A0ABY8VEH5_9CORY|nr:hypothetical protein [Corynebacterium breve]WIM67150.1 hypothetical protein QP027_08440 [Corynebacterium breve]